MVLYLRYWTKEVIPGLGQPSWLSGNNPLQQQSNHTNSRKASYKSCMILMSRKIVRNIMGTRYFCVVLCDTSISYIICMISHNPPSALIPGISRQLWPVKWTGASRHHLPSDWPVLPQRTCVLELIN
jgi:hypothetical protein